MKHAIICNSINLIVASGHSTAIMIGGYLLKSQHEKSTFSTAQTITVWLGKSIPVSDHFDRLCFVCTDHAGLVFLVPCKGSLKEFMLCC